MPPFDRPSTSGPSRALTHHQLAATRGVTTSSATAQLEAARQYLRSVYRDDSVLRLTAARVRNVMANSNWFYHIAREVRPTTCVFGHDMWRSSLCHATQNGTAAGLLLRQNSLIYRMNDFGFWSPRPCASKTPKFLPDNTWAEVVRVERKWHEYGEGGGFGCWFFRAVGSGVYMNTGRSLRAHNRSELAAKWNLNIA